MSQKLYSQLPSGMRRVLTEEAAAIAFVDRHQNVLRYDTTGRQWFLWGEQILAAGVHRRGARTRARALPKPGPILPRCMQKAGQPLIHAERRKPSSQRPSNLRRRRSLGSRSDADGHSNRYG